MQQPPSVPVLTYARVRPALKREVDAKKTLHRCLAQQPGRPVLHVATKPGVPVVVEEDGSTSATDARTFELDGVFDEGADTDAVYDATGRPLVDAVLTGVNGTILCYGMTGSGKTHTILGDPESLGIVGLAAHQLFAAAERGSAAASIECSFMQLYGTVATDLLVAKSAPSPLKIARRDDEVVVEGLSRRLVSTVDDVNALITEGVSRRKVASQRLNSASSRSHAVLTFYVTSVQTDGGRQGDKGDAAAAAAAAATATGDGDGDDDDDDETVVARCAKLVCVDLAGSERVKESSVSGTALREAQEINLSLFHLIRVVQVLNEQSAHPTSNRRRDRGASRVPYSDSPLTLLLSDALGGAPCHLLPFHPPTPRPPPRANPPHVDSPPQSPAPPPPSGAPPRTR